MSAIVFALSEEASARIRAYCDTHGADLNGLACDAVRCLMDVLDDDWGGPWLPEPSGLATGHDSDAAARTALALGAPPQDVFAMQMVEAVLCSLNGSRTSIDVEAERRAEAEEQVRECVAELRAAGMPVRAIADELDRLGHRNRNGGKLRPAHVDRILCPAEST